MVVVGEALVDVVLRRDGSVLSRPGGSPANVAVGLGRLGLPVTLVTCLADDEHGRSVTEHLTASHVQLQIAPIISTAVAQAVLDDQGQATYTFEIAWDLGDLTLPEAPTWLHVGSIGATLQPGARQLLALVKQWSGRTKVSYDPNCRPLLMGTPSSVLDQVEALVALSDVVKLSDEDAGWLFPELTPEQVLRRWAALGPSLVVMTLGAQGALGLAHGLMHEVGVPDGGPVVDTVGAGDAFMSGLIAAVSADATVDEALARASLTARRTCERIGADPPWAAG